MKKLMKKFNFIFLIALMAMVVMSSCSKEEAGLFGLPEVPEVEKEPEYFDPVDSLTIDIIFDDGSREEYPHRFGLKAQDSIFVEGSSELMAEEELYKEADSIVVFPYNHGVVNTLMVEGLTVEFSWGGKKYNLESFSPLHIAGSHQPVSEETSPYKEVSETDYVLVSAKGIVLASATQVFVVEEGYVPPTVEGVEWSYSHVEFDKNATITDNVISVFCNNVANFAEKMSDGALQNEAEISYSVLNKFSLDFPKFDENELKELNGTTIEFNNGVAVATGKNIMVKHLSASVESEVVYAEKNYAGEIKPCVAEARTISFTESSATIRFYGDKADDYAELTISIDGEPVYEKTDWSYSHKAFQRNASFANGVISVICDNSATFAEIWSDGSKKNEKTVNYKVVNKFSASLPEIVVDEINSVVGRTFNFANGVVTVANKQISIRHLTAMVSGKVVYGETDYTSKIKACVAAARTITFASANQAVIRFYDDDANDYAEIKVAVSVKENVTLKGVEKSFKHLSYRSNAAVSGNSISIICDNEANFVKVYSDGHKDAAVTVDYTVTNRFIYSIPELPLSAKGQTLSFNAGTAVVEGRNISVDFSSAEKSAIMFEGKDYRGEAPNCRVAVKTIYFGESTAEITFDGGVTAEVPVDYIDAEVIPGDIVGMWVSDSYDGNRTYVSTDLHILTENNGAYKAYSRNVNGGAWTETSLSAAEGQSVLSSGRAMAWALPQQIGTVSYIKADKSSTGYVITYFRANGEAVNIMGDAEAALNGKPFECPVKATGSKADGGLWSIKYNGSVNYFVNK